VVNPVPEQAKKPSSVLSSHLPTTCPFWARGRLKAEETVSMKVTIKAMERISVVFGAFGEAV